MVGSAEQSLKQRRGGAGLDIQIASWNRHNFPLNRRLASAKGERRPLKAP